MSVVKTFNNTDSIKRALDKILEYPISERPLVSIIYIGHTINIYEIKGILDSVGYAQDTDGLPFHWVRINALYVEIPEAIATRKIIKLEIFDEKIED